MGAGRRVVAVVVVFAGGLVCPQFVLAGGGAETRDAASSISTMDFGSTQESPQTPSSGQSSAGSSSNKKGHRHTTVAEDEGPPPELTKAEELIQKQDFAGAEPLLRRVVESDPANYVAWFDLGFAENGLGKTADSIAAYRKSVEAKPDVFESNLNLGLQLAKGANPEAEQFLRAATRLKPTSHVPEGLERAWISLAHVLETTKPEEAVAAYHQAAALRPKDAEPHLGAGLILEKQNQFADAEHEYKQAEELDPASVDAATGLANIYMRGRNFPEAEKELRKVVQAYPNEASGHIQLGRVLAAAGKNDDAIVEMEAGAKLAPNDTSVQRDLADLYAEAGKNAQAQSAYRVLIAVQPNDAELHQKLGEALLRDKKFGDAQHEFLTSVSLKPDLATAYGDLAFAASENKDYALTLKALDARAKLLPEIPITYFLRASAFDHLRDVKHAVVNYHLFLQTAEGKYPDQEWQAKHRLITLEPKK